MSYNIIAFSYANRPNFKIFAKNPLIFSFFYLFITLFNFTSDIYAVISSCISNIQHSLFDIRISLGVYSQYMVMHNSTYRNPKIYNLQQRTIAIYKIAQSILIEQFPLLLYRIWRPCPLENRAYPSAAPSERNMPDPSGLASLACATGSTQETSASIRQNPRLVRWQIAALFYSTLQRG